MRMMDEKGNDLHRMASERPRGKAYLALRAYVLSHPEALNERDDRGHTPLDAAIYHENELMMNLLLQGELTEDSLLTAIGDMLAYYFYIRSSRQDAFLFRLMKRKGRFSESECRFLLGRALNGNAWPFVPSLVACCAMIEEEAAGHEHGRIADNTDRACSVTEMLAVSDHAVPLRRITAMIDGAGKERGLFLTPSENGYIVNPAACVASRRRHIGRRAKQKLNRWRIDLSLLRYLMSVYLPDAS